MTWMNNPSLVLSIGACATDDDPDSRRPRQIECGRELRFARTAAQPLSWRDVELSRLRRRFAGNHAAGVGRCCLLVVVIFALCAAGAAAQPGTGPRESVDQGFTT